MSAVALKAYHAGKERARKIQQPKITAREAARIAARELELIELTRTMEGPAPRGGRAIA
jgi:hypothetical protein